MNREGLDEASHEELVDLVLASHARLEEVEQQLRWFKNQLFGAKSERRIVHTDPSQLSLGEAIAERTETEQAPTTQVRGHVRRNQDEKKVKEEPGLRFDDTVPMETIGIEDPETRDLSNDEFEIIAEKKTYRLAQRPASYVIIEIVRRVSKRKADGQISCPAAAESALPGSYADVRLLAGMMVDKIRY